MHSSLVNYAMEIEKKRFQRIFPHLFRDLESKNDKRLTSSTKSHNRDKTKEYENYQPSVIDFIRRCDTEIQAEEIINFLEKRQEVTREYANQLRKELAEKGIRNFGKKKGKDYYLRTSREK
jgi:hypothetical protein